MFSLMRLHNATKLFPNQRLCVKKTPCPSSKLLATNAQGTSFLLNTQTTLLPGGGGREESVEYEVQKQCPPSMQFSQQFCPRLQLLYLLNTPPNKRWYCHYPNTVLHQHKTLNISCFRSLVYQNNITYCGMAHSVTYCLNRQSKLKI